MSLQMLVLVVVNTLLPPLALGWLIAPQACFAPFAIALGLSWLTARASTSVDPESRPTTASSRPSTGRFATSA
jgi:hypothetical protein